MTRQTVIGIVVACLSLSTAWGGVLLIQHAWAMAVPIVPQRRTLPGTVVDIIATRCGTRKFPRTCYRPVVAYTDGGTPMQAVSRTRYGPASPHDRGDRVDVFVETGGTTWISSEWNSRYAERVRDYQSDREFPLVMGWLLVGCAGFGVLLAAGIIFWVDRSGEHDA